MRTCSEYALYSNSAHISLLFFQNVNFYLYFYSFSSVSSPPSVFNFSRAHQHHCYYFCCYCRLYKRITLHFSLSFFFVFMQFDSFCSACSCFFAVVVVVIDRLAFVVFSEINKRFILWHSVFLLMYCSFSSISSSISSSFWV